VEGVRKMVHFLVGQETLIGFNFEGSRRPIQRPILVVAMAVFKTIFIQQIFDKFHFTCLEAVEVSDLVSTG
jgi:hypothetical protein